MNSFYSKELARTWKTYTIHEQMANIGAEVGRSINWKKKNNEKMAINAFYRALELIDFTVADKKNCGRLSEILRMRELLVDFTLGENIYKSTSEGWEKYFLYFNYAASEKRH